MLTQPLLDQLSILRLSAFRQALEEQLANPRYAELSFEERLGLLVDHECTHRDDRRLHRLLQAAHLPASAVPEDVDLSPTRGVARAQWLELLQADWVRRHLNVILSGPTGVGKTYLAGALGYAVCRADLAVSYHRTSRLLRALELAKADGSYGALLDRLARTPLLVLDDWLRDPLSPAQTRDLLEIIDDRCGRASTLLATQVPVPSWYERLADPTLADALLDRLVHQAYQLTLKGDSRRKRPSPLTHADQ